MRLYYHLLLKERHVIQKMLWKGEKICYIALLLNRSISTVKREIERNSCQDGFYRAVEAHKRYLSRRSVPKKCKIENNQKLLLYILEKILVKHWSPLYISGQIAKDYRKDQSMRISYESIYQWLYKLYRNNKVILWKYLPRKRRKRRRREHINQSRIIIADKKSIHIRTKEANLRKKVGHWEGDTIVGSKQNGYIATFVDKTTRFLVAAKMENAKSETCVKAINEAFGDIPNKYIKTITVDNGSEFAKFKNIEEIFECNVYFADPYSAWQRGLNEQTNSLIRRYLPKGTSFLNVDDKWLAKIVWEINTMPRKVLNFNSPYDAIQLLALRN